MATRPSEELRAGAGAGAPEAAEPPSSFLVVRDGPTNVEVGHTLEAPVPQTLGWLDQLGLWGNLGVSLLGFTGAIFVLQPFGPGTSKLAPLAALVSIVVGTVLGAAAVAVAAVPGARTGAPAMVLLRGLLGGKGSYLPTALNILQCLGWGTFEIVVISGAAHTIAPSLPRDGYVLIAGAITTLLTLHPLKVVRLLRRVLTLVMLVALAWLAAQLFTHPITTNGGSWSGFFVAMDTTIAVAVSWVPLASDYTRHSRSERATVGSVLIGFSISQTACYGLGLLALLTVASSPSHVYHAFVAVPLGAVAFGILALRETDQSFTDAYSAVASIQNVLPRADRRVIAASIGALVTVLALVLNVADYENFLLLIGSVFVPLFGVLAVDFFLGAGRPRSVGAQATGWDLSGRSRLRPALLAAWFAGFVAYQLIDPGQITVWADAWAHVDHLIGIYSTNGWSASLVAFGVSAGLALVYTFAGRRAPTPQETPLLSATAPTSETD